MTDDFVLDGDGRLGRVFRELGVDTFAEAAMHVERLPYRRPVGRDPEAVLREGCGTCSSKHALLALLAQEHGIEVDLMVGIYEMRELNTPGVGSVLDQYGLTCIPEAHCYLRMDGQRVDFTGLPSGPESPFDSLLKEESIDPSDVRTAKESLHRAFIEEWASARQLDPERIWEVREGCITALVDGRP